MSTEPPGILFIASDPPWPLDSGVRQRQYNILQALASVAPVDLLALPASADPPPPQVAQLCRRVRLAPRPNGAGRRRPARTLLGQLFGWPLDRDPLPRDLASRMTQPRGHSLVWIERLQNALLLRHPGGPDVVLDMDDVEHRKVLDSRADRQLTGLRYLRATIEGRAWASAERDAVRRFGRVLVCKDEDRRYLAADNVAVIPNGITVPKSDFAPGVPGRMLFVGLMSYLPNDDAVRFFAADVLPRVRAAMPEAHLHVAGAGAKPGLAELAAAHPMRMLGFVDDLSACYRDAAICVAPLRAGSGTAIKVLEALAHRRAVVATPQALAGLDLKPGIHLEAADTAAGLAHHCIRLLGDEHLRRQLAEAGFEQVRRLYDWPIVQRQVQSLASDLLATHTSRGQ